MLLATLVGNLAVSCVWVVSVPANEKATCFPEQPGVVGQPSPPPAALTAELLLRENRAFGLAIAPPPAASRIVNVLPDESPSRDNEI